MATIKEIKEAIESLNGGGILNKKVLMKEAIKAKLKLSYGVNIKDEDIDKMADNIMKDAKSFIYQSTESVIDDINNAIQTIPSLASSLSTQVATIPAVVTGFAAPAAAPMVLAVKSQASSLKCQLSSVLTKAASLGIDIPGIDPILGVIKVLKPLL